MEGKTRIVISKEQQVTDELVEAIARLLPQLSQDAVPPTAETISNVISPAGVTMWTARVGGGGRIVGMTTLVVYRVPTRVRGWIEDVVVDEEQRGHGIGEAMIRAALEHAAETGATCVDLTSRPDRQSARRLYERIGFVERTTAVYRFRFDT